MCLLQEHRSHYLHPVSARLVLPASPGALLGQEQGQEGFWAGGGTAGSDPPQCLVNLVDGWVGGWWVGGRVSKRMGEEGDSRLRLLEGPALGRRGFPDLFPQVPPLDCSSPPSLSGRPPLLFLPLSGGIAIHPEGFLRWVVVFFF